VTPPKTGLGGLLITWSDHTTKDIENGGVTW